MSSFIIKTQQLKCVSAAANRIKFHISIHHSFVSLVKCSVSYKCYQGKRNFTSFVTASHRKTNKQRMTHKIRPERASHIPVIPTRGGKTGPGGQCMKPVTQTVTWTLNVLPANHSHRCTSGHNSSLCLVTKCKKLQNSKLQNAVV